MVLQSIPLRTDRRKSETKKAVFKQVIPFPTEQYTYLFLRSVDSDVWRLYGCVAMDTKLRSRLGEAVKMGVTGSDLDFL